MLRIGFESLNVSIRVKIIILTTCCMIGLCCVDVRRLDDGFYVASTRDAVWLPCSSDDDSSATSASYILCNRPVHNSSLIWSGWAWQIPCFKYCLGPAMLQMRSSVSILRPCREAYGTRPSPKLSGTKGWLLEITRLEVCNLSSSSCQFVQVPHLGPTLCISL